MLTRLPTPNISILQKSLCQNLTVDSVRKHTRQEQKMKDLQQWLLVLNTGQVLDLLTFSFLFWAFSIPKKKMIPKTTMIKIVTSGNRFPKIGFGSVATEDPPMNRKITASTITNIKIKTPMMEVTGELRDSFSSVIQVTYKEQMNYTNKTISCACLFNSQRHIIFVSRDWATSWILT